jgi:hypothetical protein
MRHLGGIAMRRLLAVVFIILALFAATNVYAGEMSVTKCKITAGKTEGYDTILVSGTMNATADDLSDADDIQVTIDSTDMVNPCVQSFPIDETTFKKGKYKCSKTENSSKTSFTFDTKTSKFSFTAKNVDLSGLGCPLTIEIDIGDYTGEAEVNEATVNGPKKPIPIKLMMGVKNSLRVDRYKVNRGKKPNTDQLSVKGGFSVADTGVNLAGVDFVVGLAGQTWTIPAGSFTEKNGVFTCKNVKLSGIANAGFNLNTCVFTLTIKNTKITAGPGAANFSVEFADFNESVPIVLPANIWQGTWTSGGLIGRAFNWVLQSDGSVSGNWEEPLAPWGLSGTATLNVSGTYIYNSGTGGIVIDASGWNSVKGYDVYVETDITGTITGDSASGNSSTFYTVYQNGNWVESDSDVGTWQANRTK